MLPRVGQGSRGNDAACPPRREKVANQNPDQTPNQQQQREEEQRRKQQQQQQGGQNRQPGAERPDKDRDDQQQR